MVLSSISLIKLQRKSIAQYKTFPKDQADALQARVISFIVLKKMVGFDKSDLLNAYIISKQL